MPSMSNKQLSFDFEGIGQLLKDNRLCVPDYQRSYAWTDENVKEFFDDIETSIGRSEAAGDYFIGSIVLVYDESKPGIWQIVDGQQRLATATILLAGIRDYFYLTHNIQDRERATQIEGDFLFQRNRRTQEENPRLRLNELDHDFFLKCVLFRPDSQDRESQNHIQLKDSHKKIGGAVKQARDFIERFANQGSGDPMSNLMDLVEYVESKVKVIWITVQDYANAYVIFETLNDRGLELAGSDLLKNYLYGRAQNRIDEVKLRWNSMSSTLEALDTDEVTVTFIRHFWSSKHGLTRKNELYKKIRDEVKRPQDVVTLANELEWGAQWYAAVQMPEHEFWNEYGTLARQHIRVLNTLRVEQNRPFMMYPENKTVK